MAASGSERNVPAGASRQAPTAGASSAAEATSIMRIGGKSENMGKETFMRADTQATLVGKEDKRDWKDESEKQGEKGMVAT